jgi:hypothetical protein
LQHGEHLEASKPEYDTPHVTSALSPRGPSETDAQSETDARTHAMGNAHHLLLRRACVGRKRRIWNATFPI